LGRYASELSEARDELARFPLDDLKEVMRLFLAHPLWAVGEAAATVLSSIVEEDEKKIDIIDELLEEDLCALGAIEAAFAVRHIKEPLFLATVRNAQFSRHLSARVRGLCAENLVSMILTNDGVNLRLLQDFKSEIEYWLQDEDCWVLEHMYRLIHGLKERGADLPVLNNARRVSRLLHAKPNWFTLSREAFLLHIERQKRALVSATASNRRRTGIAS
jgi:hypothetical protein